MAGRENGARISGYLSERLKKWEAASLTFLTLPSPQRKQAPAIKTMTLSLPFVCERKAASHWQTSVPVKATLQVVSPPSLQLSAPFIIVIVTVAIMERVLFETVKQKFTHTVTL